MQVRKDMWHYRLYKLTYDYRSPPLQTNLCAYFWRTVGGALLGLLSFAAVLGLLGSLGWLFYVHTFTSFSVLGLLVASVAFIFLCKEIKSRRKPRFVEDEEPGLILSYLKARKAKVCPIVTFTEIE